MFKKDIKTLEILVKKRLNWDFLWSYNTFLKWNWSIFRDLRQYIIWDSIKNIDWKSSARYNNIQIKNFEEERDLKVLFLLDLSYSMNFWSMEKSKLDLLFEVFFILAHSVINWRDKFWILVYNSSRFEYIDFKYWEENLVLLNKILDKFLNKSKDNLLENKKAFFYLEKLNINNSLIFILSDKMKIETSIFKYISSINELVYINIFDYFENYLIDDNISIDFSFNKSFFSFFSYNKKKREDYIKLRQEKIEKFKLSLNKLWIDYIYIDTKTNLFKSLIKFFNKKTLLLN